MVADTTATSDRAMLTICIPTKNRPDFLGRLLRYYASTRYRHWLCIADASDPGLVRQNQETVASLERQLHITYWAWPGLSACAAIEQMLESVATPYFACGTDDDFLCTQGLERCIEFLDRHPDYGAAHGVGFVLLVDSASPYGPLAGVRPCKQAVLEAGTASRRLEEFLNPGPYPILYAVRRTLDGRAMFQGVSVLNGESSRNLFKDELIPACVSAVQGKVRELDCLYLLRQIHGRMFRQPTPYDWITSPDWFPSYQMFRNRVAEELMRQDRLNADEAEEVIKRAFSPYLARELARACRIAQAPAPSAHGLATTWLRRVAKRVPGLYPLWQRRIKRVVRRHPPLLSALLDSRSPYHEEFMRVYRMITTPPSAIAQVAEEAVR